MEEALVSFDDLFFLVGEALTTKMNYLGISEKPNAKAFLSNAVAPFKLFSIHEKRFVKAVGFFPDRTAKKHKGAGDPVLRVALEIEFFFKVKVGGVGVKRRDKVVYSR